MPRRRSAFPGVTPREVSSVDKLAEEIANIPAEQNDGSPEGFTERRRFVRRRADRVQGRSLEILGHAIEYLVDTRMFVLEPEAAKAEREAVQILMRLSRTVFSECEEVVTLGDRLAAWWRQTMKRRQAPAGRVGGATRL